MDSDREVSVQLMLPLAMFPTFVSSYAQLRDEELTVGSSRRDELVPQTIPVLLILPLAPEKEPDRVAPVELTPLGVLAVVTVAVGSSPPAPPPDPLQLVP